MPIRATLRWDRKRLGFTRSSQRQGWLLLLDNDRLLGLARHLQPDENAIEETVIFEMSGLEFPYLPARLKANGALSTYDLDVSLPDQTKWSLDKIRRPDSKEDCLIVSDPQAAGAPLSAMHIEEEKEDRWLIAPSISYNTALDGACVVSREDGSLIGFLDLSRGQAEVVFVEEGW